MIVHKFGTVNEFLTLMTVLRKKWSRMSYPETRVYFSKGFWYAEYESEVQTVESALIIEIFHAKKANLGYILNYYIASQQNFQPKNVTTILTI